MMSVKETGVDLRCIMTCAYKKEFSITARKKNTAWKKHMTSVIIGKTLPLIFLPGVYPLKNFANKTLPRVSEINFFIQMRNPPPSWENPPHRYCDVILHCLKILKIDQSSQALQRNLLALHCFTIEHL